MKIKNLAITSLFVIFSGNLVAENGDPLNGKTLSQTCAACHNTDGNSVNPIWPKLAGQHSSYTVKQLQNFKEGKRVNAQMASMVSGLSKLDMQDLGAYYASQKIKTGKANPDTVELGKILYRAGDPKTGIPACMACHGPAGRGNPGAVYPALAGQHAEYTKIQLNAFKTMKRNNDINAVMRTIVVPMTDTQIKAVSEYIQGLH